MFVAGWRHALRSEWPFIISIIVTTHTVMWSLTHCLAPYVSYYYLLLLLLLLYVSYANRHATRACACGIQHVHCTALCTDMCVLHLCYAPAAARQGPSSTAAAGMSQATAEHGRGGEGGRGTRGGEDVRAHLRSWPDVGGPAHELSGRQAGQPGQHMSCPAGRRGGLARRLLGLSHDSRVCAPHHHHRHRDQRG